MGYVHLGGWWLTRMCLPPSLPVTCTKHHRPTLQLTTTVYVGVSFAVMVISPAPTPTGTLTSTSLGESMTLHFHMGHLVWWLLRKAALGVRSQSVCLMVVLIEQLYGLAKCPISFVSQVIFKTSKYFVAVQSDDPHCASQYYSNLSMGTRYQCF